MAKELTDVVALSDEELAALFAPAGESMLQVPAKADEVDLRYAPLSERDRFGEAWRIEPLRPIAERAGWYEVNLQDLQLDDGAYEYEYVVHRDGRANLVPDPYAEEITRFGGYRGVFHIRDGKRWRQPFSWEGELSADRPLPNNHEMVIYEMPLRWMDSVPEGLREVALGTFEKTFFAHLDDLTQLGINGIELLPVQDSADTLSWGYGSRFFFAPDLDMGGPIDLKFFVKQCHQRGIRVIFDVVMNHARDCSLATLDHDRYFLRHPSEEPGRSDSYGGDMFRYRARGADGTYAAREFHFRWLELFIRDYHADGFRIDEFRGIDNWKFIQEFRDRAWKLHQKYFPRRPFLVIAEDSWRRAVVTHDAPSNPHGRKVADAMWNFAFRDEIRRALRDQLETRWGEPSRRQRLEWAISGRAIWDDWKRSTQPGFYDLSQAVNYLTSHDVEGEHEKRIMNYLFAPLLRWYGRPEHLEHIRWIADNLRWQCVPDVDRYAHGEALERVRSAFALLLTSVGIPMILAGDEFGDVHDLDHTDWRLKMTDPVSWDRRFKSDNNEMLWRHVRDLIHLRTGEPALQRNEIDFFYFHPTMDDDRGEAVFAYCRTGGQPLGRERQVVVVANVGGRDYREFHLPWPWRARGRLREIAPPSYRAELELVGNDAAKLSIAPLQARVFAT